MEIWNLKKTFLTKNHIYNQYQCKNTKGTISKEAYLTIKKILVEKEQAIIFIDGEEDLLALPLFAMAPKGSVVLYGQPLEGIVLVNITEEKQNQAKDLMNKIFGNLIWIPDSLPPSNYCSWIV